MHQMFKRHRLKAAGALPFVLRALRCGLAQVALVLSLSASAAPDIATQAVTNGDFQAVREALIETIEADGLVVSAVIPFGRMLERTGEALDKRDSPYSQLEIVQFCSASLAWRLVEEDVSQAALCPLSIVLYSTAAQPGQVVLAHRQPGQETPGRRQATTLVQRIIDRAAELAGYQRNH